MAKTVKKLKFNFFIPISVFRATPQLSLLDNGLEGKNINDFVINHKNAISPTNGGDFEKYYIQGL